MIIGRYFITEAGTITCSTHLPDHVKAEIEGAPRAMSYAAGAYARLYQHESDRYLNAGVTCPGCWSERERNRIALQEHLSRR